MNGYNSCKKVHLFSQVLITSMNQIKCHQFQFLAFQLKTKKKKKERKKSLKCREQSLSTKFDIKVDLKDLCIFAFLYLILIGKKVHNALCKPQIKARSTTVLFLKPKI